MTWGPVKNYIEKHMKVRQTTEEPVWFDQYDPESLANILETQHKITKFLIKKERRQKPVPNPSNR